MKLLFRYADNRARDSVAARMRRKRFALISRLIDDLARPATILDVGGTEAFWEAMDYLPSAGVHIVLLNLTAPEVKRPGFSTVRGDARNLGRYRDNEFDLVVSNSVIEHVGEYEDQALMATEIMRVGRRFVVQTPNRSFFLEPHFLFPFFPYLHRGLQVFLLTHLSLGWYAKFPDKESAEAKIDSIRLLTKKELKNLFNGATLYRERLFGFTKSFVALDADSKENLIRRRIIPTHDVWR